MRDIERELRALGEAERERDGQAHLDRRSLRRIRMNRMLVSGVAVFAILGLVGGGTYAASALRGPNTILPADDASPQPSTEEKETPFTSEGRDSGSEHGVTYEIGATQCGRDSEWGLYCHISGQMVNDGSEEVRLEDVWQVLHFGEERVQANNAPFKEYFQEYFTTRHGFALPIEPGGELPADVFFPGTPEGECPDAIEFHTSADSEGVVIPLEKCHLN